MRILITTNTIQKTTKYTEDRIKELEDMKRSFVNEKGEYITPYGRNIFQSIDEELEILNKAINNISLMEGVS